MDNILLNNGETVLIGSNRDIVEVVAEHCSRELSELIEGKIEAVDSEQLYAEERALTDCNYYESELENYSCTMNDALDELVALLDYVESAKRVNKDKIYQKINEAITTLRNVL